MTGNEGFFRFLPDDPQPIAVSTIWRQAEEARRWLLWRVGREGVVAGVFSSSVACLASIMGAWRGGLTLASLPYPARGQSVDAYRHTIERMLDEVKAQLLLV